MERARVVALALLLLTACGGESARGDRTFEVAEITVREDGRVLLAGTATRGNWDSEDDDYCDGDGPATRDLAVIEVGTSGGVEGVHSLSEDELDGCAVEVNRAILRDGALVVDATVRESPGLIPGEGGPESREDGYTTRFEPEEDDFDEAEHDEPSGYAEVPLPDGGTVAIAEDPTREQRTAEGLYMPAISLIRWTREGRLVWAHPLRAVSRDAYFDEIAWEGGRGWEVYRDDDGRFYGFAHYWLISAANAELVLFRHGADGRPDPSFGESGRVVLAPDVPWSHRVKRAVRVAGGDFVVAGDIGGNGPGRVVVRRVSAQGERRRGFDRAAARAIDCRGPVALATQSDGLLVACSGREGELEIMRLRAGGRLDGRFGRGGRLVVRRV